MSTYEYYEFLALDRPLTSEEQTQVREVSTRAEITATSFTNDYQWGEFKGDPYKMVTRFYDAYLHYADWGQRRLVLKLPRKAVDVKAVEGYWAEGGLSVIASTKYVVIDCASDLEGLPEYEEDVWDQYEGGLRFELAEIAQVRDEIAAGDYRALYLAWLAAYRIWEIEEEAFPDDEAERLEPPVPPGLKSLSGPQRALADFLRLDESLIAVAAETSPNRTAGPASVLPDAVAALSETMKDKLLLLRVAAGEGEAVRLELLKKARATGGPAKRAASGERTVGEILDAAAARRMAR